jgi:hypothetical protein
MIRKKRSIEPGQRYRPPGVGFLGRPSDVWVVEDVFTASDAVSYARIALVTDRTRRKTLSLTVLSDPRQFLPVGGGDGAPAATG